MRLNIRIQPYLHHCVDIVLGISPYHFIISIKFGSIAAFRIFSRKQEAPPMVVLFVF